MLDLSHEPDLGFVFYPYEMKDHPGHPRLDVIIQEKPTYQHYDPQKVQYKVVSIQGTIEHITIHHPWTSGARYQVCAGRIILHDRKAKRVEAFTFGGDLQILSDASHTVCGLVSTAPIFALCTTHDLPMWITAEVEILLAEQNAHWESTHPYAFEEHLATLDPFILYASCLEALRDRSASHLYINEGELDKKGEHFVQAEIQRLQKTVAWPQTLPTLDELFSLET